MTKTLFPVAAGILLLLASCQQPAAPLTEAEKQQIVDSTTMIVRELIAVTGKSADTIASTLRRRLSDDPDARHMSHGWLYASVGALTDSVMSPGSLNFRSNLEFLDERPDAIDVTVLSRDAVAVSAPCHYTIKMKGGPEFKGQEVSSFVLQKRNGKWMVTQSHISEYRMCEAMAAVMPKEVSSN